MPTMIHSTEHTKRGSSSIDLQSLLVCLVIVFACIVTSFGLAKLTELLRTRRRDQSNEPTAAKGLLAETAPCLYTLPATGYLVPAVLTSISPTGLAAMVVPRKLRPQELRNGAIQYAKSSPYLLHISSPRSYALRHRRRLCFHRPGPSPLRSVITATPQGKLSWSLAPYVQIQRPTVRVLDKTPTHRSHDPLERPAFTLPPQQDSAVHIEIPACVDSPDAWPSIEQLYRTADAVVGAHPDDVPLSDRERANTSAHPQPFYSWVGANVKFGLVHGNNAAFGARRSESMVEPFVRSARVVVTARKAPPKFPRPFNHSRNGANADGTVKKGLARSFKANANTAPTTARILDAGKENVAVCH